MAKGKASGRATGGRSAHRKMVIADETNHIAVPVTGARGRWQYTAVSAAGGAGMVVEGARRREVTSRRTSIDRSDQPVGRQVA